MFKREVGESERDNGTGLGVKLMPRCWHLSGVPVSPLVPVDTVRRAIDRAVDIWL